MKIKKLELDKTPYISRVDIDEFTDLTSEIFDHEFTGENIFYSVDISELELSDYNIGLIIGKSGSGKSLLTSKIVDIVNSELSWDNNKAIISHFETKDIAIDRLLGCGLSSIPDLVKPYNILSNGQKYRATLSRILKDNIGIDEFTSVIDRDNAKSLSLSINKFIRKNNYKNVVLNTCHNDIIPFLKPDYIIDLDKKIFFYDIKNIEDYENIVNHIEYDKNEVGEFIGEFKTNENLNIEVFKLHKKFKTDIWNVFKSHHYLTSNINLAAHTYVAYLDNNLVGLNSCLAQPSKITNMWRGHRLVILPEYQGLGIGGLFADFIADIYYKQGKRYFSKFSHPKLAKHRSLSDKWKETSNNGISLKRKDNMDFNSLNFRYDKVCYSFEYIGDGTVDTTCVKIENIVNENEIFIKDNKIVFAKPVRKFTKENGIVYAHIKRLYKKTQKHVKGYRLLDDSDFKLYLYSIMDNYNNGDIIEYDDLFNEYKKRKK